jgi:hypothetical protein
LFLLLEGLLEDLQFFDGLLLPLETFLEDVEAIFQGLSICT